MKKIVIFGATGNIGAYTTVHLKNLGYDIIAVGNRESDNGFFTDRGMKYFSLNITKKKDFDKLPRENIYAVINLAGTLPSRNEYNPYELLETITNGTLNILEYTRISGGCKIIFPQTPFDLWYLHNSETPIEANRQRSFPPTGDHSIYTIAKNAAVDLIEHYYNTFGIKRFILRFFTIYQYHPNAFHYANFEKKKMPFRILIDNALNSETIEIWGDPERSKEIVYIKDFVQLIEKCILSDKEGGIYNVGNEAAVTLKEQIQGIIDVFSPKNKRSSIVYKPEMPQSLLAKFDITKTKKELGYEQKYSYIEAMRDFYEEMKNEPFAQLWGSKEDYK